MGSTMRLGSAAASAWRRRAADGLAVMVLTSGPSVPTTTFTNSVVVGPGEAGAAFAPEVVAITLAIAARTSSSALDRFDPDSNVCPPSYSEGTLSVRLLTLRDPRPTRRGADSGNVRVESHPCHSSARVPHMSVDVQT